MSDTAQSVTIAHASFWYVDTEGRMRWALRGETIDVAGDDLARGLKHGAFATEPADDADADSAADPASSDVDDDEQDDDGSSDDTNDGGDDEDDEDGDDAAPFIHNDATADEVLEHVGHDKALIAAALDAERADGGKGRSTLIKKLEALAASGE